MSASASNSTLAAACALVFSLAMLSAIQAARAEDEPAGFDDGQALYQQACAFCHGPEARGNGIAAPTLDKEPADLTQLSKNNGGVFPWRAAYRMIDGKDMTKAHGTRAMPIFGDRWSAGVPAEYADYYVRGKIMEILLYLETIQAEPDLAESAPTEPDQAESAPTEPDLAESAPTEPRQAESVPTEPRQAESAPTEPRQAETVQE